MSEQSTSHRDSALTSMTMRVLVPFNDVRKIVELGNKKDSTFSVLSVEPVNGQLSIIVFLLESSFSLYALGKLVAYSELLNMENIENND